MRRGGAGAALVLAALLASLPSPAAGQADGAAVVSEVGWWSQRPGAAPAPAGGFEVASGLRGDQSVAALRVTTSDALSTATLVLDEVGGRSQDMAALQVCPVTSEWEAANPGPFTDAPTFDCDAGSAALARDADASEWRGDVSALLIGGAAALMVVPDPGAEALPVSMGAEVAFGGAALEVTTSEEPAPSAGPTPTTSPEVVASPSFDAGPATPAPSGSPTFASPSSLSEPPSALPLPSPVDAGPAPPAAAAEQIAAPAVVEPLAGGTGTSPDALLPVDLTGTTGEPGAPWIRLLLLVPLCAAAGAAVGFGRQPIAARLADLTERRQGRASSA